MNQQQFYAGFRSALPGRWTYDGATAIDEDGFVSVPDQLIWVAVGEAKEGRLLAAVAEHINVAHSADGRLAGDLECGLIPSLQMRFASNAASADEYRRLKDAIYPFLKDKLQLVWNHWEKQA